MVEVRICLLPTGHQAPGSHGIGEASPQSWFPTAIPYD